MTEKILVTGGAGFIGSHLVDALVGSGHDVRILDNIDEQVHQGETPAHLNPSAEFIKADVRSPEAWKKALEDVEVIFHEAAAVGVGQSMYKIREYMEVNTQATALMLETLTQEEHDVKKVVTASSMSIYGEGAYDCGECGTVYPNLRSDEQLGRHEWEMFCPKCGRQAKPIPTSEEKPLHPTSIYAISKRDQEEMSQVVGKAYGIPTTTLRYFNVYGSRQSLSNPYTGVAAIFSSNIKNNNPPKIFEDGLQSRDLIHVKDIVQANQIVMKTSKSDYETYNVGNGRQVTILEMAEMLIEHYQSGLKPKIMNKYRSGDIRHCYSDCKKLRKLGFEPEISLEQGLNDLVSWGKTVQAVDLKKGANKMKLSLEGTIK
ncbi:SDR family NAD(P)-dependent oxidoreductase, partial [Candidatus Altiarchaeota archaeon]